MLKEKVIQMNSKKEFKKYRDEHIALLLKLIVLDGVTDLEEIEGFLEFFGCSSLLSNISLSSSSEGYSLFKFTGDENEKCNEQFTVLNIGSTISAYRGYHAVLFMDKDNDFDSWYCDFSKKKLGSPQLRHTH